MRIATLSDLTRLWKTLEAQFVTNPVLAASFVENPVRTIERLGYVFEPPARAALLASLP